MDKEFDLSCDSNEQLQTRWRNAHASWLKDPDTPLGQRAARLMGQIEEERHRRSINGAIERFLADYPLGFEDPAYRERERDDKCKASELAQALLSRESFANEDDASMVASVKRVLNATNLVQGSFEKPKFVDALQDPGNTREFLRQLCELLHGDGETPARLASFSDYLHTLGLRKWTYPTYFLFLMDPGKDLFVKPESIKKAAGQAAYDIGYEPAPTASGYVHILEFADWVDRRLRGAGPLLDPKDRIDTQSFIWYVAPTGKFAKD